MLYTQNLNKNSLFADLDFRFINFNLANFSSIDKMSQHSGKNYRLNLLINRSLQDSLQKLLSSDIIQNRLHGSLNQNPTFSGKPKIRKNNLEGQQCQDTHQKSRFPEKQTLEPTTDEQFARRSRMRQFSSNQNLKLDPRDEKILLPFQSSYYPLMQKNNFQVSLEPFQNELRDWLVDLIEICTSIGFNHLKAEILIEKEAKAFICKNVIENIKNTLQKYPLIPLGKRFELLKFINSQSYQIFDHIAKKYPLTSSKGVSKRLKSKIQTINNRQNQEFDFLFRNNISIKYRQDGDYTEDIMKIVNKLISFSNEVFDPQMEMQETNYQIFTEIMEFIFDNSGIQPVKNTANEVVQLLCSKKQKIEQQMKELQKMGCSFNELEIQEKSSQETRKYQKDLQRQVLIGHKIPIDVPLFTEEDIQSSNFKVFDSSILRMLTKWAQELRNKIMNAQQSILRRMHKFKCNNGRLLNIEPTMKQILYEEASKQIQVIQTFLKGLQEENYYLQTIFAEEINRGKYTKNDTKVGVFAAKVNEIAGQYIFKYINQLIHSLLSIPIRASQRLSNDRERAVIGSIDLVTFKIGDIMRCKCSSPQPEFIKIMQVIDELHTRYPNLLKIVRIKNRLQTQNNDILVNFLFGNKAECQLQLSVLSKQKKHEKYSSTFSHLIYQIIRAQLGPISEMANIIVQYDPLAYFYSKSNNFGPELIQNMKQNSHLKKDAEVQKWKKALFRKQKNLNMNIGLPFVCCTCDKLSIVHNPDFFYRDLTNIKRQCNECLFKFYRNKCDVNSSIKQKVGEHILIHNFQEPQIRRFFRNHLQYWDPQIFIQNIRKQSQTQVNNMWFPSQGYMVRMNQKKPMLQLFTCVYDPQLSMVIFARIDDKGEKKKLASIKIHCQKQKKIKTIQKQMSKFMIFTLKDTKTQVENEIKYFRCNRKECCDLRVKPGPILERSAMIEYKNQRRVQIALENQHTHVDLNYIPKSFEILEKEINKITQNNKVWKIRNTVQVIEAFDCKLYNISIVQKFIHLTDLNVGQNRELKSLKGIEKCFNLKYLDCNNCDLENINELTNLLKLEEINLTNNQRLTSIEGLSSHPQLINVDLRNTAIQSLAPLSSSLKLQAIDIQGCNRITTLKDIQSAQLTYISIINCLSIQQFDLSSSALRSLKNVQIYKNDLQGMMAGMIANFSMQKLVPLEKSKSIKSDSLDYQAIMKINQILKIRRSVSAQLE